MREALRIHYDLNTLDEKIRELCDAVNQYTFAWKMDIFEDIRKLGDYLSSYENSEPYKIEHLHEALKRTRNELSQLVHHDGYKRRVSYEDNFIQAANPYFRTAKKIEAISIASVSTFWDNPEVYNSVVKYLRDQSGDNQDVVRLFVFRNPAEANYFKNILQANYRSYGVGRNGGVFLCSIESYDKILMEISRDRNFLRSIQGRDFGRLQYENENEDYSLIAILDAQQLEFERIHVDDGYYVSLESFSSYMQSLLSIPEGESDKEKFCLRWTGDFYKNPGKFAYGLEQIFDGEYGPIMHLVLVKTNKKNHNEVKECLHKLKAKFEGAEDELELHTIWLRERKDVLAHDGRFLGPLITNKTYDFALGVEFENERALQSYYQHKMHSVEREALYISLEPQCSEIFLGLSELQKAPGTEAEVLLEFSKIEKTMKKYITRLDVRLHERIKDIVHIPGSPFGSKFIR